MGGFEFGPEPLVLAAVEGHVPVVEGRLLRPRQLAGDQVIDVASRASSLSRTRFASTSPVRIRWMPVSSTR